MQLTFDESPMARCPYCGVKSLLLSGAHILCKAEKATQMMSECRLAKKPIALDEARRWPQPEVVTVETPTTITTASEAMEWLLRVPGTKQSGPSLYFACPRCTKTQAHWRTSSRTWACSRCGEAELDVLFDKLNHPAPPLPATSLSRETAPSISDMIADLTDEATRLTMPKGVLVDDCPFCQRRRGFAIYHLQKPPMAACTACSVRGTLADVYQRYRARDTESVA